MKQTCPQIQGAPKFNTPTQCHEAYEKFFEEYCTYKGPVYFWATVFCATLVDWCLDGILLLTLIAMVSFNNKCLCCWGYIVVLQNGCNRSRQWPSPISLKVCIWPWSTNFLSQRQNQLRGFWNGKERTTHRELLKIRICRGPLPVDTKEANMQAM